MVNDVLNLLNRFEINTNEYLEVEHTIDYKEAVMAQAAPTAEFLRPQTPATGVEKNVSASLTEEAVTKSVAVVNTLPSVVTPVEPVPGPYPEAGAGDVAALTTRCTVADVVPSLRALLNEAAHRREAEARAHDEKVLRHASRLASRPAIAAQVIAIVSLKGGVGKSTICATLSSVLSGKARTIAVDLDPQNALQYYMNDDVHRVHQGAVGLMDGNWSALLHDGAAMNYVLPYGAISEDERRAFEDALLEDGHWLARQLADMNLNANDVVVLDTPTGRSLYLDQVLDVADQVVVVVTPDAGSFITLDHIEDLFEGHVECCYVVNQFDASRTFCQDMLEVFKRRFESKLIGIVPLDHAMSEGHAYGNNPLLQNEQSLVRNEIQAIGDVLRAHVVVPESSDDDAS